MRAMIHESTNRLGLFCGFFGVDQTDFWQPPRPWEQRIIPQPCPLSGLMMDHPWLLAYFRAASICLLACLAMHWVPQGEGGGAARFLPSLSTISSFRYRDWPVLQV